ncbi:hypothetical protein OG233_10110 [Streptomyces sp. NBC_01218]|uniref:hypothetical protein n=1 Tax=unclassified Streptomyces TaxID=2593676 RepID=UPI002E12D445|nr:hypothetical protein OG233_10110 [Streptomyces sp. NBC_01218]
MIWESIGSVVIGLALSWAALHVLPGRLPSARAVYPAGALGALFGAYLADGVLYSGHAEATAAGALVVGAVTLSLLLRPRGRRRITGPAATR